MKIAAIAVLVASVEAKGRYSSSRSSYSRGSYSPSSYSRGSYSRSSYSPKTYSRSSYSGSSYTPYSYPSTSWSSNSTRITIPQVSWNQTAIDAVVDDLDAYATQAQVDDAADKQSFAKDLVNVYATWEVQNYMTFGSTFKPFVQFQVDALDAMTVDDNCDAKIATKCINTWILSGADSTTMDTAQTCIKEDAGCTDKFDDMTAVEKQALADKFETSVANIELAYTNVQDKVWTAIDSAWTDHMDRRDAMGLKFVAAAETAIKGMGCSATCSDECFSGSTFNPQLFDCLGLCKCGTNVIKFTPGQYSSYYEDYDGSYDSQDDSDDDGSEVDAPTDDGFFLF